LHRLEEILQGQMDMLIEPLITHFQAEALKGEKTFQNDNTP
jgi:protein subunit release factor A